MADPVHYDHPPPRLWKTGEELRVKCEGRTVNAHVILASRNGGSLAIGFEAILAGHAGMMPLLWNQRERRFESLFGHVVELIEPS